MNSLSEHAARRDHNAAVYLCRLDIWKTSAALFE